jgi:DNA-binding response OmpR family regulator
MSKVLLIEPDRVLQHLYSDHLKQSGHSVTSVYNAQDALTLADQEMPDVIILELQLIEHSGIEFLYEFRSYVDWQAIPVIINTIVPPTEFRDSYKLLMNELGVRTYLYKPHSTLKQLDESLAAVSLSLS